jgi:late competence protein required for DNA uptake (superfamily II DNA/RNA helicase)
MYNYKANVFKLQNFQKYIIENKNALFSISRLKKKQKTKNPMFIYFSSPIYIQDISEFKQSKYTI